MINISWLQLRINLQFYKRKLRRESGIKNILFRLIEAFCYIIIFSYINYLLYTINYTNIHFKGRATYKSRPTKQVRKRIQAASSIFPQQITFLLLCYLYLQTSTFKIFGFQLSTVKINCNHTGSLEVLFGSTRNSQ